MLNTRYSDAALQPDCPYISASADDDSFFGAATKSAFFLNARMKEGKQCESLTSIITECRSAVEYGFTTEEYNRYLAEFLSSMDNLCSGKEKLASSDLASECYNNYLFGYDVSSIDDYVRIFKIAFTARCSMQPEKCDSVLTILQEQFHHLPNHVDPTIFNNVKENSLKSWDELTTTTNGFWLGAMWNKFFYNYEDYSKRRKLIENMTIPQVQEFMKEFIESSFQCEILMKSE